MNVWTFSVTDFETQQEKRVFFDPDDTVAVAIRKLMSEFPTKADEDYG